MVAFETLVVEGDAAPGHRLERCHAVELTAWASLVGRLVLTLGRVALHLLAPRLRRLPGVPETPMASGYAVLLAAETAVSE